MNNQSIGVFDSGVGGLTVFKQLDLKLGNEDYIYFGDTENLPYGNKSKDELIYLTKKIFDFFKSKNVKAVIMACNTTSAAAYEELKNNYDFKIYPIIQSSVANMLKSTKYNNIGIFATQATVKLGAYKKAVNLIDKNISVCEIACPEFVPMVENNTVTDLAHIEIIKRYVEEMLKFKPNKIILGCTHYPYLIDVLSKFAPGDIFVDPSKFFVDFIIEDLTKNNLLSSKTHGNKEFYVSANSEDFLKASSIFYKLSKTPKQINLDLY